MLNLKESDGGGAGETEGRVLQRNHTVTVAPSGYWSWTRSTLEAPLAYILFDNISSWIP